MPGLIQPLFYEPAKHIAKLCVRPEYRWWHWLHTRYGSVPRQSRRQIQVHGWQLEVPDVPSFLSTYSAIFVDHIYDFRAPTQAPVILDCGANIGVSVLYFKRLYPQARITAFEADPKHSEILKKNIHGNGFTDVELINRAVWNKNTTVSFSSRGNDAGRIDVGGDDQLVQVQAVRLADYLEKMSVDFLKVDIEGAEVDVLLDCGPLLGRVGHVFVEYHSFAHRPQDLGRLLDLFQQQGFRVHTHAIGTSKQPYMNVNAPAGMDLQLNLFFWKDRAGS